MYARVAIASDALDINELPLPAANALHRALTREMRAHGRLIFGNDLEVQSLLNAITSGPGLTPDARAEWRETLLLLRRTKRITVLHETNATPLADVTTLSDLRKRWGPSTDLAVVGQGSCAPLGVPSETGILTDPSHGPDVAITASATNTPAIARLIELADRGIAGSGTPREAFWHNVLEPMAESAQNATVMDGYLFKSVYDITANKPWARQWRVEQTAWLLDHLDAVMSGQAEVHLIGSTQSDYSHMDAQATADAIRDHWKPTKVGRLNRVTLTLAAAPAGRDRFPHDRHIRFSTGSAIEVPAGFDRLRQDNIWDPDGMKWTYRWSTETLLQLQAEEQRAIAMARHPVATVLQR
jgi:hypothetical protein